MSCAKFVDKFREGLDFSSSLICLFKQAGRQAGRQTGRRTGKQAH